MICAVSSDAIRALSESVNDALPAVTTLVAVGASISSVVRQAGPTASSGSLEMLSDALERLVLAINSALRAVEQAEGTVWSARLQKHYRDES